MRFITEFELIRRIGDENIFLSLKDNEELRLGRSIAESFGWDEKGFITLNGPAAERCALEIEAFPMDKWERFKAKMYHYLIRENISLMPFENMVKELESFGNPAGAAKQQDNG